VQPQPRDPDTSLSPPKPRNGNVSGSRDTAIQDTGGTRARASGSA